MSDSKPTSGGSYIHIPPVRHMCPIPRVKDPLGTIWRCDTCHTYWRRIERYVGFGTEETWTTDFWRNLRHWNLGGWWNAEGGRADV